ncbi:hypothetical protein DPMN_000386 [Dreissena polymorpha]|uniref:DDE-1 domain-containing protein n=1 Tax=Dreissena polymorpha TaxID=45954 RepID=A0A9D4RPG4_DREPO|nr:hypothetical protein DPMN_000386 [Dreissena polymorpha]
MDGATAGADASMSETGLSNADLLKQYMETHFLKYENRSDMKQPVLLIFSGHSTHTSPDIIFQARARDIHLFVLPAHTSHIL